MEAESRSIDVRMHEMSHINWANESLNATWREGENKQQQLLDRRVFVDES